MGPSNSSTASDSKPFDGLVELRREHDALLEQFHRELHGDESTVAEARVVASMRDAMDRFVASGVATGAVIDERPDRATAQTLVDYWITLQIRAGQDAARRRLERFDPKRLPELDDKDCPYVGLEPFEAAKAVYFFGRDSEIDRLATDVEANRLVIVHGTSGSGKSSLVFGGLLPKLSAQKPPRWSVRTFVPGAEPTKRLAAVVADPSITSTKRLVVIDQFEELFTLVSEEERVRFDEALSKLFENKDVHVVITVREEFFARMTRLKAFANYHDFSMRPMGIAELTAAIEGPATKVNLQFEKGLVEILVSEVLGQPAALPLLQFSLMQLWKERDRNRITRAALEEMGGPRDALARAADSFFEELIEQNKREVRRILLALVRVDDLLESYRQPVNRSELRKAGVANTDEALQLLVENGLVRITPTDDGKDAVVEIKHEAIIRNWPRLDSWIIEKREARASQLALARSAQAWDQAKRPPDGLYRGWQLEEAAKLEGLSALEREFIKASQDDSKRDLMRMKKLLDDERELSERRRRLNFWALAALVFIVVVAIAAYWFQAGRAAEEEREARAAESKQRSAEAAEKVAEKKALQATLDLVRVKDELQKKEIALAEQARALDALSSLKGQVKGLRDAIAAIRPQREGKPFGLHIHGQVEEARRLAALLREAGGMDVSIVALQNKRDKTVIYYYYPADATAAQRLADAFAKWVSLKVEVVSREGNREYFTPTSRPKRGLIELYFVEAGVPNLVEDPPAGTGAMKKAP